MSSEQMNAFALKQEDIGKKIKTIYSNAKKDSISRKVGTYAETRLNTLEDLWNEAKVNHSCLENFNDANHSYFRDNYFDQMKAVYEETKEYLKNFNKSPNGATSKMPLVPQTVITEPAQEQRLKRQTIRLDKFNVIKHQLHDALQLDTSDAWLEALLKKLQSQWISIEEMHEEIMVNENAYLDDYFTKQIFMECQAELLTLEQEITNKIAGRKLNPVNTNAISLPKIALPIFDGNYENWCNFYGIFSKIIHENETLSKVLKMHYLKTHVRGEASKIIQHLHIAEENYDTAWDIILRRYQNEKMLVAKYIDKILDLPSSNTESVQHLKQLHDVTSECIEAVGNFGFDTKSWGPLLGRIITRKFDPETNRMFELNSENPTEVPEFGNIMEFLRKRFQALEICQANAKMGSTKQSVRHICPICSNQHSLNHCIKFRNMSVANRIQFVNNKRLCSNCLNHDEKEQCYSQQKCFSCGNQHHTMLHREKTVVTSSKPTSNFTGKQSAGLGHKLDQRHQQKFSGPSKTASLATTATQPTQEGKGESKTATTANHTGQTQKSVLLATALVQTKSADGSCHFLRVLLDQGSQSSFITEEAAQRLAIPRERITAEITGLGDGKPKTSNSKVLVQLKPRFPSEFSMDVTMLVLPKLTKQMPENPIRALNTKHWRNHLIADPNYSIPGPIDALLGAEEYSRIILNGVYKTNQGLVGQNTEFGWIFSGPVPQKEKIIQITSMITRTNEEKQLTKFWEIEEVQLPQQYLTEDDQHCEDFYLETTTKNQDGSYTVRIPFKTQFPDIGSSKPRAVARFLQLEKRFARNRDLHQQYAAFMNEYALLGHMKAVPIEEEGQGRYYIPHQPVIREDSTTTKLRVVFDASSRSSNNNSLNDVMYVGPKLQQNLTDVLLRWRKHSVVFKADIEKMYRQIKIHPEDQQYQRIVWRSDPKEPLREYELTTVTYGTASAPFLAIRTLQQLARDEAIRHPEASKVALRDFYVDDLLSGASNLENAKKLQSELQTMFKSGHFLLRKWSSNVPDLLLTVPEHCREQIEVQFSEEAGTKSLGILWAPIDDTFRFHTKISTVDTVTKRHMLSEIARLFDPLGWLAPVVIKAKLLIQDLWIQQLDWDETVNQNTAKSWREFQEKLPRVEKIRIPRWMHYETGSVELHGFCDASEKAYGAMVYSRVSSGGKWITRLLIAKSKVAPVKSRTTLPRLELCAAVLLAKLLKTTQDALQIEKTAVHAWSDSMITLGWIKGDITKWKTFVANRVAQIQNLVSSDCWNHVQTDENPADAISRGMDPDTLYESTLWWHGPSWLSKQHFPSLEEIPQPEEETKKMRTCLHTKSTTDADFCDRFSTLTKMMRVMSYCRRFIKKSEEKGNLTFAEMNEALLATIKWVQRTEFPEEVNLLMNKKSISKKSKLLNLDPFLDTAGILRVGGRLHRSSLQFQQKHPILLPYKHHVTALIIEDAHRNTLHGGIQATLAYSRRKYWILQGRRAVSSIIHNCITCTRYRGQVAGQQMGQLPPQRVNPSPPFTETGVDYAGPIQITALKGRGHKAYKGYIAIFVCMVTKAIHIEVVSDLTTEAFLAAFRRFTARRGHCAHIYSDNGTNFIGASQILTKEVKKITKSDIVQDALVNAGTQWHFIPPSAPHFGGLWEAGVKSMKHHLRRVIGNAILTFEELTTITQQIEACLNSRPLCPLTNDINDFCVLTPGHFLVGRPLISPPDPIEFDLSPNLTVRWKLAQKIKKDFWNSWTKEYLGRLQQRYKWKSAEDNIRDGTLVLQKEDNINPSSWPLARIVEVYPAQDGKVRVVTIKKADGTTLKRPIHKLIPLPLTVEKEENADVLDTTTTSNVSFRSTNTTRKKPKSFNSLVLLLLTCLFCSVPTFANYTIHQMQQGLYVEHLGKVNAERGMFRVQVRIKMETNITRITNMVNQFHDLCQQSKSLSDDTHCTLLTHHLVDQEKHLSWILNSTKIIYKIRERRGLLGKLMTSIFGVNDEVYQDINTLESNQKELIKASHQQTKIMLSAISSVNHTEERMVNQLNRFRIKLNQALASINSMQHWYSKVYVDTLNIHILGAYQVASNYIDELCEYYSRVSDIHFNRGTLYDVMMPAMVEETVSTANRKLPSHLHILSTPLVKTISEREDDYVNIFGYFLIIDVHEFNLLRVTPTPLKITNDKLWEYEVPADFLAVNYDSQSYFQLADDDFQNCYHSSRHNYVCSPLVIKSIENNPNCAIDVIYQRTESSSTSCKTMVRRVNGVIWKQLYMLNAWMYTTPKSIRVAIICNGVREDVMLNSTGIIRISQDCAIQTKRNLLTATRTETSKVLNTYMKEAPPTINGLSDSMPASPSDLQEEPVFRLSDELTDLHKQEEDISQNLNDTHWKTLGHHPVLTSLGTTLLVLVVGFAIWVIYRIVKRFTTGSARETTNVEIEMGPVNTQMSTDLTTHPSRKSFRLAPLWPSERRQNV